MKRYVESLGDRELRLGRIKKVRDSLSVCDGIVRGFFFPIQLRQQDVSKFRITSSCETQDLRAQACRRRDHGDAATATESFLFSFRDSLFCCFINLLSSTPSLEKHRARVRFVD